MAEASLQIGPYELHPIQGLSISGREVRVTPKALAVLAALAHRPGRIVTKSELFREVWAGTVVTEAALSSCIRELRRALDDDARDPRYIETVHRRGFRLLVNGTDRSADQALTLASWALIGKSGCLPGCSHVVERLEELAGRVQDARTEVALISGPAGIGKTALLGQIATRMSQRGAWLTCDVSCADPAEAFGTLLEILDRLRNGPAGVAISSILRRCAPSWVAELPGGQARDGQPSPDYSSGATTRWRVRELRDAFTAITGRTPLVVCLDGLHQCDEETLNFILRLAQDPGKTRVLLVATCNSGPIDRRSLCPSIIDDLRSEECCTELELGRLDKAELTACLQMNASPGVDPGERMAEKILQRTEGWPLLVSFELDGQANDAGIPTGGAAWLVTTTGKAGEPGPGATGFSRWVRYWLGSLGDAERRVLEAASLSGPRFSIPEIAAVTTQSEENVTEALTRILRGSCMIFETLGRPLANGSRAREFSFVSEQLRAALLELVDIPRQTDLHRRLARWSQQDRTRDGIGNLSRAARHFEQAGESEDAARCWYQAGATARRRGAHGIALRHFRRAMVLQNSLPRSPARDTQLAKVFTALGRESVVLGGFEAPKARRCYQQALEMARRVPPSQDMAQVLWRLWVFRLNRGRLETASEIADRLLHLAKTLNDPRLLVQAHHARWGTSFMLGDFSNVLEHTRSCMAVCGSGLNGPATLTNGCTLHDAHLSDHNVAICAGFFGAWADAIGGRPEAAIKNLDAVVAHGRDICHPFTLALALVMSAGALAAINNAALSRLRAGECRSIAQKYGFTGLVAWAAIYEGWALVELGETEDGMTLLRDGMAVVRKSGMALFRPFQLGLAAAAQMQCGQFEEASRSLAEALTVSERSGQRFALPEVHRLRGELGLITARNRESSKRALEDLESAVRVARAMGASLWEERATAALEERSHAATLAGL